MWGSPPGRTPVPRRDRAGLAGKAAHKPAGNRAPFWPSQQLTYDGVYNVPVTDPPSRGPLLRRGGRLPPRWAGREAGGEAGRRWPWRRSPPRPGRFREVRLSEPLARAGPGVTGGQRGRERTGLLRALGVPPPPELGASSWAVAAEASPVPAPPVELTGPSQQPGPRKQKERRWPERGCHGRGARPHLSEPGPPRLRPMHTGGLRPVARTGSAVADSMYPVGGQWVTERTAAPQRCLEPCPRPRRPPTTHSPDGAPAR